MTFPSASTSWATYSYPAEPTESLSVECPDCGIRFATRCNPNGIELAEERCTEWLGGHRRRRHNIATAHESTLHKVALLREQEVMRLEDELRAAEEDRDKAVAEWENAQAQREDDK